MSSCSVCAQFAGEPLPRFSVGGPSNHSTTPHGYSPQLASPAAVRGQPPHTQQHNMHPQPTTHESAKRRLKAAASAAAAAVAAAAKAGDGGSSGASKKRRGPTKAREDLAHNDMALVAGDDVTLAQHLQVCV